ncbi:MAG: slipin family protein [Pseudomonadota bacterium]
MMLRLIDSLMGRKRVLIDANERAIYLHKGEVRGILGPGEHVLPNRRDILKLEWHNLVRPELYSDYEQILFEKAPEDAAAHLTMLRTSATEIAVIERDGVPYAVLAPDRKLVLWTDAGPWKTQTIDIGEDAAVDGALLKRLQKSGLLADVAVIEVDRDKVAILSIDGVLIGQLKPGIYGYWKAGRKISHKLVDVTRQPLDVTGQEVLTRDRVTLRINISAEYRVTDPVKATTEVKDFTDALYRALQYAFRKTLGAMTLDQILEQKVTVNAEAAEKVRADMAEIGLEVSEISLKDVVLPGDMRELLNQVVSAQKEAEANVIRRREETNATRSLLNTAKVMSENPVMLRLKELEALETIAGKVDRLTVNNGTSGLMNDIVKLSADETA